MDPSPLPCISHIVKYARGKTTTLWSTDIYLVCLDLICQEIIQQQIADCKAEANICQIRHQPRCND